MRDQIHLLPFSQQVKDEHTDQDDKCGAKLQAALLIELVEAIEQLLDAAGEADIERHGEAAEQGEIAARDQTHGVTLSGRREAAANLSARSARRSITP